MSRANNVENLDEYSTMNNREPASIAIIYKSELDYISRCILDNTNIETGGQLFGFWTADNVPVVLYAIGPGGLLGMGLGNSIQKHFYLPELLLSILDFSILVNGILIINWGWLSLVDMTQIR